MDKECTKDNIKEMSRQIGKACLCFNLRKASRLLSQVYDQALKPTGLKATQFSLLMAVAGNDGITIGKLARPLGMDRTTLSRNARILEKKGLIRTREGEDRRTQVLNLTENGAGLLLEAIPLWEQVQKQLIEKIGERQLEELLGSLRDLLREYKS